MPGEYAKKLAEANEIAAKTNALLKKSKADKVDKAIIEVLEISAAAADEVVSAFQDPHAEELKLEKKHADEKKTKDALAAVAPPTAAQLALAKQAKFTMNLNKAQRLLGEVIERQNMYVTAAQYNDGVNNKQYVIPALLITSFASFVSFCSSSTLIPMTGRSILALFVGLLGTIATIITAMQSAYKLDTKAEMFRNAAGEYRLLNTRITSEMRKDPDGVGPNWEVLWLQMEKAILEIQKKMPFFPPGDLVAQWKREGKLDNNDTKSGELAAWLFKYRVQLEDDGITHDSDLMEIEEDRYDEWLEKGRYPKAIIMKMKRCTTTLKEIEAKKAGPAPTIDLTVDKHLEKLNFKVTTLIALRMQGICGVKDLRLCTDDFLDRILRTLLMDGKPPALVTWTKFEMMIALVRAGGKPGKRCCNKKVTELSERAEGRIEMIAEAMEP